MALSLEKRSNNVFAVGSFAAKTYFAELLRMVENGSVITITRNGHDVATVQSPETRENKKALAAWHGLCAIGKELNSLQKHISIDEIQEWKNEGRK